MRISNWILPIALASLSLGCSAQDAESGDDGLTESIDNGDASKADALSTTATYYTIRRDFRKCAAPRCGGWYVKRVNFATTKCANGTTAAECYVSEADFAPLGLSDEELGTFQADLDHSVVRGVIGSKTVGTFGNVGKFKVTEGWHAATATAPVGYLYNVKDNGIRCITFPCFSLHEAKLNSTVSGNLSDADFSENDASADQIDAAQNALASGIILSGVNVAVPHAGPAGTGKELVVSQIYFRVKHVAPTGPATCGGFIGKSCPSGQYCDITIANACNGADLPGVCKTPSDFCIELYKPVCGCDGHTYGNDCFRLGAKVQLAHTGTCN